MKRIYFDHSASTPVDKKVLSAMLPYFSKAYGNPSSIHGFGQEAYKGVDKARQEAAKYLGCKPEEVIFTSGATEADNLAIKGLVKALKEKGFDGLHAVSSVVEHDAVLEPFMELDQSGVAVDHAPVKANGVVDPDRLKALLKPNTVLVSVMWVNSEVGAVMPVREIGKMVKNERERRERDWAKRPAGQRAAKPLPIYFHCDATQGIGFYQADVADNYIDLLSLSGHKIYGPKGVGLLYRRQGVPLLALQRGGHHENNYRSGTLNTAGIVGLGAALAQLDPKTQDRNNKRIAKLRDRLVAGVMKAVPDVVLNTDRPASTPAHAHFSVMGVEGESLLMSLDMEGIAVSTGSACASGSLKASHVLIAMGIDKEVAHYSIRITLGKHTSEEDIKYFLKKFPAIVARLRKMNPIYKK